MQAIYAVPRYIKNKEVFETFVNSRLELMCNDFNTVLAKSIIKELDKVDGDLQKLNENIKNKKKEKEKEKEVNFNSVVSELEKQLDLFVSNEYKKLRKRNISQ